MNPAGGWNPLSTAARLICAGVSFWGMEAGAQQKLDTVKVSAEAPPLYISSALRDFEARRVKGPTGRFVSEKELRVNDNRTLPDVLRKLTGTRLIVRWSNTYVASTRGTSAGLALSGNPNRPCLVAVYLDGLRLYGGPGDPPVDVQRLQVRDLGGVEFYQGGASVPQEYSMTKGSDCGTLLLWSRER